MNKGIPEPERLIKLHCADTFGDYWVIGKWVLYKRQKNGRFMVKFEQGNSWTAARKEWDEREHWEYVGDPIPPHSLEKRMR